MSAHFALVTDSTSDIPGAIVAEQNISVVPLHIIWGQNHFIDGVNITPPEFFERLAKEEELPTTSQPMPSEFAEAYQRARDATDAEGVLVITISKDLSGTYDSAQQAASMVDFPVQIVDSRTASIALGLIVLKVAEARDNGASLAEASQLAESLPARTSLNFTVDTLEYLHKGGRIGGARRLVGNMLNIKPILHLVDGKVEARESVRTRKRAHQQLVNIYDAIVTPQKPVSLGIIHANAPSDASDLKAQLIDQHQPERVIVTQITSVISVHIGPGAVGFAVLQ